MFNTHTYPGTEHVNAITYPMDYWNHGYWNGWFVVYHNGTERDSEAISDVICECLDWLLARGYNGFGTGGTGEAVSIVSWRHGKLKDRRRAPKSAAARATAFARRRMALRGYRTSHWLVFANKIERPSADETLLKHGYEFEMRMSFGPWYIPEDARKRLPRYVNRFRLR